jgi:hypothetical protein
VNKRRPESWFGFLSVLVVGIVMVGTFFLAGGLGSGRGSVALASSRSSAQARVVTLSVANCAGPSLTGSLGLSAPFTGQMTLGLFFLSQTSQHLTRQFIDSGLRASADFDNSATASFTFRSVPGGAPAYEVVVLPPSGKITGKTALIESQAMPPCGTRRVTETATTTLTVTIDATVTSTGAVAITVPSYHTVTVHIGTVTGSVVTSSTLSSSTVTHFTTTMVTTTKTTTIAGPV